MRIINTKIIEENVRDLCMEINRELPADVYNSILSLRHCEQNPRCVGTPAISTPNEFDKINDIINNCAVAKELNLPICQDTGMAVVFIKIGQDVHLEGKSLYKAVNDGVASGYKDGYMRMSIVTDPLNRVNTNTNTPVIIHTEITDGDNIELTVCAKGFGSENMSEIKMLLPTASREDIINEIVKTVKKAGDNACPPMVIGIGIGGDFEYCAYLAKKALCRDFGYKHDNDYYNTLENDILSAINTENNIAMKIGIEYYPTHIAGLPLAVNIGCHVNRHKTMVI